MAEELLDEQACRSPLHGCVQDHSLLTHSMLPVERALCGPCSLSRAAEGNRKMEKRSECTSILPDVCLHTESFILYAHK